MILKFSKVGWFHFNYVKWYLYYFLLLLLGIFKSIFNLLINILFYIIIAYLGKLFLHVSINY